MAPSMEVIGTKVRLMEEESISIPMGLYMLDNSTATKLMEMEKSKDQMELHMKENGVKICSTEMENRF